MSADFFRDVRLLTELVIDLDADSRDLGDEELEPCLIAYAALEEARRNLAIVSGDLEQKLAKAMPRQLMVEGVGTFERHKRTKRTQWDREALVSAVLDSRLFDRHTGELIEESPLDKVRAVWLLGAPRITALRDREIDAEQFCSSEDAGYQIRVIV